MFGSGFRRFVFTLFASLLSIASAGTASASVVAVIDVSTQRMYVTVDGGSDLFGAIVGKTLTVTGSGHAHYDEALELDEVELPTRSALVQ